MVSTLSLFGRQAGACDWAKASRILLERMCPVHCMCTGVRHSKMTRSTLYCSLFVVVPSGDRCSRCTARTWEQPRSWVNMQEEPWGRLTQPHWLWRKWEMYLFVIEPLYFQGLLVTSALVSIALAQLIIPLWPCQLESFQVKVIESPTQTDLSKKGIQAHLGPELKQC